MDGQSLVLVLKADKLFQRLALAIFLSVKLCAFSVCFHVHAFQISTVIINDTSYRQCADLSWPLSVLSQSQ